MNPLLCMPFALLFWALPLFAEDAVLPTGFPVTRYTAVWENSPFNREVVKAGAKTMESSFAGSLVLEGLVTDDQLGPIAYVRDVREDKPIVITREKSEAHPFTIVSANQVANPEETKVTVTNGTMTVTGAPVNGQTGTVVPFTINGTNLKNVTLASQVSITTGSGVTVTGTPVPNALGTQVTGLSFNIAPNATVGGQTMRVVNADGNVSTTNFLTVTAPPCPADFNNDSFVDDTDFVIFAAAYNLLDCADPNMPVGCPADLNNDGFVDDTDFVLFATAYETLICP